MQDWLKARLADLESAGLLRAPADSEVHLRPPSVGGEWLDACSNDYLGLGARPVSRETLEALATARAGAGGSRLVQGTFDEHTLLERELADWVGAETCLLTLSAFAANVGLLPALGGDPDSLIVSDALNHASIVDGCRLARARVVVTPHHELDAVEAALRARHPTAPAWVITEGLFSMDGDCPNLVALQGLCSRYDAGLIVDEAHSIGVLGPGGAGLASAHAVQPVAVVAGLGKAVGAQGGVIAGSTDLRQWLWNRARSFAFSTAPSPALALLTLAQVRATRAADAARTSLRKRSAELRSALRSRGWQVAAGSDGPIVPLILGSNERALSVVAALRARGILVQAIRPPTVPKNTARLRLTVHADWPADAVVRIVDGLEAACAS